jgi:hypothetical protein
MAAQLGQHRLEVRAPPPDRRGARRPASASAAVAGRRDNRRRRSRAGAVPADAARLDLLLRHAVRRRCRAACHHVGLHLFGMPGCHRCLRGRRRTAISRLESSSPHSGDGALPSSVVSSAVAAAARHCCRAACRSAGAPSSRSSRLGAVAEQPADHQMGLRLRPFLFGRVVLQHRHRRMVALLVMHGSMISRRPRSGAAPALETLLQLGHWRGCRRS